MAGAFEEKRETNALASGAGKVGSAAVAIDNSVKALAGVGDPTPPIEVIAVGQGTDAGGTAVTDSGIVVREARIDWSGLAVMLGEDPTPPQATRPRTSAVSQTVVVNLRIASTSMPGTARHGTVPGWASAYSSPLNW